MLTRREIAERREQLRVNYDHGLDPDDPLSTKFDIDAESGVSVWRESHRRYVASLRSKRQHR